MDCKTARLLLELALPRAHELEASEVTALDAHLAECGDCGSLARAERRMDQHLGVAVRAVSMPAGLRARLVQRLESERSTRQRGRRLRLTAKLAAAAAILLAVGVWWYSRPLPGLNLTAIHAEFLPRRAEEVERYFAELGVRGTVAPPQFHYGLLAACHLVKFQDQTRVPYLLFRRDGELAEVYILSAQQFDRDAALAQGPVDSGGYTVEVRPHPNNEQVFYLIKYPTGSLPRFLTDDVRPTT